MKKIATTALLLLGSAYFAQGQIMNLANVPLPAGTSNVYTTVDSSSGSGQTTNPVHCGCSQEALTQGAIAANHECFCDNNEGCWDDEDDCNCGGKSHGGGSGSVRAHTVAVGATIIPAVEVETEVDCQTTGSNATNGIIAENVRLDSNFQASGNLRTDTYECAQGTFSEGNAWQGSGSSACAYCSHHETDEPVHCDCKNLKHHDADHWFNHCDCGGDHEEDACNPEDDIDNKINKQIDKAIGDVLSEVVERCISSSLKGCIEM